MAECKRIKFFKYQGAGNDFILIEDFDHSFTDVMKEKIPFLCDRHYGIGADGFILLQSSIIASCKMRIYNSDGGEAEMCGNGLRCAVKHFPEKRIAIETEVGISLGENVDDGVSVTMSKAEFVLSPLALPNNQTGHLVNTGVPHLIINVNTLDDPDFATKAYELRNHSMFSPNGVNVSYICLDKGDIHIRTYERGVEAETLACGTACAASVLVMRKHDKKSKSLYTVYPKSGNLLEFTFDCQERIWMKGPAKRVFHGEIELLLNESKKNKLTSIKGAI